MFPGFGFFYFDVNERLLDDDGKQRILFEFWYPVIITGVVNQVKLVW